MSTYADSSVTGEIVSRHPHPRPLLRRATTRLTIFGLILSAIALLAQIGLALALWPLGMLFCGTAFFTLLLMIPLLLQTVLHPQITVTERGLRLRPMLWRRQFVPREALWRMIDHPLIHNSENIGRLLFGRNYRPRQGQVILVKAGAGLLPFYRLVGGVSGAGLMHGFGISSTSHADYPALRDTIASWLDG